MMEATNAHTWKNGARGLIVLALFAFALSAPNAARAANEAIESFEDDIAVSRDGSFSVSEDIVYTFAAERHGIYRCIPLTHPDQASSFFKERYLDVTIDSVTMDGTAVPYTDERTGGRLCLTIGDPAGTVSGTHAYRVDYVVRGGLSYPDFGGAELYWNVTGNEWTVPIKVVEARVSSPDGLLTRERACYAGTEAKTASCAISIDETGAANFKGTLFDPGAGLTLAQGLSRSAVAYDVRERYRPIVFIGGSILLLLVAAAVFLYRYETKNRTGRTIVPQYEPYPGLEPIYTGYLFDRRLDARDISAGFVRLAQEGYLTVKKRDAKVLFLFSVDDYELTLKRPIADAAGTVKEELLRLLFDEKASVGSTVTLAHLAKDTAKQRMNASRLRALRARLARDVRAMGYMESVDFTFIFKTRFIVALLVVAAAFAFIESALVIAPIVAFLVVLLILSAGRRTKKGYEALDQLRGFKEFLKVTESQRYIFHNAPARNAEQFMEFLPYAIAFGVEREWAKTFEGITIPRPLWYEGGSEGAWSAMNFTASLGAFSGSLRGATAGTSASTGGGHVGGGAGGGGGGSW
ncbi:MAG TPA: DUF2207 domain-containing protein [Candidatus Paceibacterota bacterium]|nr:DUF2207 domain-containing protein [Candidatus Paceibacterota bacterium]